MIHQAAEAIGSFLITYGLPNEKKEIYVYGAECFINLVLCDSLLFLWAFVCHCVPEILFWLSSFTALRNHIGGFHAKTHWQCITFSVCTGIISVSSRWVWTVHATASGVIGAMVFAVIGYYVNMK